MYKFNAHIENMDGGVHEFSCRGVVECHVPRPLWECSKPQWTANVPVASQSYSVKLIRYLLTQGSQ